MNRGFNFLKKFRFMNYLQPRVFETISLFVSSVNCCHAILSFCCYIFTFCFIVSILLSKIVNYQKKWSPENYFIMNILITEKNKTKQKGLRVYVSMHQTNSGSHPKFAFTPTFIFCSPMCSNNCVVVFFVKNYFSFREMIFLMQVTFFLKGRHWGWFP